MTALVVVCCQPQPLADVFRGERPGGVEVAPDEAKRVGRKLVGDPAQLSVGEVVGEVDRRLVLARAAHTGAGRAGAPRDVA